MECASSSERANRFLFLDLASKMGIESNRWTKRSDGNLVYSLKYRAQVAHVETLYTGHRLRLASPVDP